MVACRHLVCLALTLVLVGPVHAQTADLSEGPLVDNFFRVVLSMDLKGTSKVLQEGEFVERKVAAQADHEYKEKVLAASDGLVDKSARIYQKAKAVLKFNNQPSERVFRPDRTFLVTQKNKDQQILTYSPKGPLTREELELTEHFNTLALTGLVPGKQVKVGEEWKIGKAVAQALCALEGLEGHDLVAKLEEVKNDVARVSINGTVSGIDLGAFVKILVKAQYDFDLKEKRLTSLTWNQSDQRDQGPANPGLAADVTIKVQRTAIEEPRELNKEWLGGIIPTGAPPAEMIRISWTDPQKRFKVQHGREWIMTAGTKEHTVWRLMNRGDLVAQVTVAPWEKSKEMMTYKAFEAIVVNTPTWEEKNRIGDNENVDMGKGLKAYRLAAAGVLDGLEVVQFYYLVHGPNGENASVTFTLKENQVSELGVRDLEFVRNLSYPSAVAVPVSTEK